MGIAQFFGFCVAAVRRVRQQFRQRGTLQPRTHLSGRRTLLTKERKQRLQEVTVRAARCHAGRVGCWHGPALPSFHDGFMASPAGLEGIKKTLVAAEQERPDVAEKELIGMNSWRASQSPGLVFVDESGANTQMTRWRGRALGGRRLVAQVPHRKLSDQHADLRHTLGRSALRAPWLFEGPMNGELFLAWVAQGLAPTLRPGDVVILDNLATHKIRGVREAIPVQGARACCICRPIRPTSTPSSRCGARSNRSSVVMPRGQKPSYSWLLRQRHSKSILSSPTAKASFLAPNTLHNKWKCSNIRASSPLASLWRGTNSDAS